MKIEVRLFATLRENRGKILHQDVPEGTQVLSVITDLKIKREEVAILLVNGRDAAMEKILQEDDAISIFPPVGGG